MIYLAGTDFSHLTDDELLNGIKALNIPDYIRTKSYGIDVRETLAQMTEMLMQLAYNQGMDPQQAKDWVSQLNNKIVKGQVTMSDLTQEVKEALTGGSVAVVGVNAVGTENVKDDAITIDKADFIEVSANLFNKNNQSIKRGYYLQGGNEVANESYYISHHIDVDAGQTWTLRRADKSAGGFFDASGGYIQSFGPETGTVSPFTFTIPENAKTMVFNGLVNSIDADMAVKGSTYPSDYIPYGVRLKSSVLISKDEKVEIMNSKSDNNFLYEKVAAFNGDSIMAGAGFTGGFAKIISDRNSMTYENIAVGGGTITGDTKYQDGRNRHYVSRTIENMRSDADYAIILAGVNDGALGVTIGEYTDGYEDTYDDTTFCGAIESMCSKLTQRFAGKKIGFIIPHKMSPAQATYVPKLIEGLEKWGVPYLNLYKSMPSLNYIDSLKITYTSNSDGWHPNEIGYRSYYVDRIESWMKTL